MTPIDQIRTAETSKAMIIVDDNNFDLVDAVRFTLDELAAYTEEVEAKERERCAVVCDEIEYSYYRDNKCAEAIRGLK